MQATIHFDEVLKRQTQCDLRLWDVLVTQNGQLRGELHFDDCCRRNIYSASKSVTSIAAGFALHEGLFSLSDRLVDVFAGSLPEKVDGFLPEVTVRDLLTMSLGQETACLMGGERPTLPETDWVRYVLGRPFPLKPGDKFVYNNAGPYLMGILIQQKAGCDLVSYLMPRLFGPLQIPRPMWEQDPMGYTFGAGGLFLTCQELHRFGLFCLQKGMWENQRLLPPDYFDQALSFQQKNDGPDEFNGSGYGYLFWLGDHHSVRADGKYGQLSILLPQQDSVITLMAEKPGDPGPLHQMVNDCLIPQLSSF